MRGGPPTHAMDLFALGCCIFELYTSVPLFTLATMIQYKRRAFDPLKIIQVRYGFAFC